MSCDRRPAATTAPAASAAPGELRIVCSFVPIYVFTKGVVGQPPGVTIEMLQPAGAGCPHDYEPSTRDAKRIAAADILVFHGGVDDAQRQSALQRGTRARIVVLHASAAHDHDSEHDHAHDHAAHEHSHDEGHDGDHAHFAHETDEHLWVSPKRAAELVGALVEGLADADPRRAEAYRAGGAAYRQRLEALAAEVDELAKEVKGRAIVTVHPMFQHLAGDLGLRIVGTVLDAGEVEPRPRHFAELAEAIRTERVAAVFCEPYAGVELAKRLSSMTGVPWRELDPVSTGPDDPGPDYYEQQMRQNLRTLRSVLTEGGGK